MSKNHLFILGGGLLATGVLIYWYKKTHQLPDLSVNTGSPDNPYGDGLGGAIDPSWM